MGRFRSSVMRLLILLFSLISYGGFPSNFFCLIGVFLGCAMFNIFWFLCLVLLGF